MLVGVPWNATLTADDASVELAWNLVNGAQSYRIEWPSDTAAISQVLAVDSAPSFPVPITDIGNDQRYAIWVRPLFAGGLGPSSSTLYATPKAASTGVPRSIVIETGRGVNTVSWESVAGASTYDVSWVAQAIDGTSLTGNNTITKTIFRHAGLPLCTEPHAACPTYAYQVRVSPSGGIAAEIAAQVVDLRPVPPLVTNTDSVLITGLKPSMSRVEIDGRRGGAVRPGNRMVRDVAAQRHRPAIHVPICRGQRR